MEELIYTVGIPNASKDYTYSVTIDKAVIEAGHRYAEIERIVTGTNHVTVCAPEYYNGPVDEAIVITLNAYGEVVVTDKLLPNRSLIKLFDAPVFRPLITRLLGWIVLTDNYGKPGDKYIESFLFNFGGAIKHGRVHLPEEQRCRFDDAFINDARYHFTGGFDFYMDFIAFGKQYHGHNFKTDARYFIKTWQPPLKNKEENPHGN